MKIKKFNESNNEDFVSIEDIEEFFYDWTDEELGDLEIIDILVKSDNTAIPFTTYIKDTKGVRKCKLVKLSLKEKPDGILLSHFYSGAKAFTNFDILERIIKDIRRFYIHTGEENINFNIQNGYGGLEISFVVSGPMIQEEETTVSQIDELLGEFKDIFKKYFRNTTLKGNWLEIRVPANRWRDDPRGIVRRINDNPNYVPASRYGEDILRVINKIRDKGFQLQITGGDNQAVFKLKKL